jgi:threonine synthase
MSWQSRIRFDCPACGARYDAQRRPLRCSCGSPLSSAMEWEEMRIDGNRPGLWRYDLALPFSEGTAPAMGEGFTPLVASTEEENLAYKLEFLFPSGSFKDRGTVMVMAEARASGASEVVQDSSGNAGASVAAYAARSGMKATIVVPASTSEGKKKQILAYGADLHVVDGDRSAAAREAWRMAQDRFYASHVWNPLFLEGTKTFAFEIWEQQGFRAPDVIFVPTGNGTLLLGAWKGFSELLARQLIDKMPRLVACQSSVCAPLFARFSGKGPGKGATVAEGIAVLNPPRLEEMKSVLDETGGTCVLVDDGEVLAEQKRLARAGFLVEPTAAVAPAAARRALKEGLVERGERIIVPLTGSGLKKPPQD